MVPADTLVCDTAQIAVWQSDPMVGVCLHGERDCNGGVCAVPEGVEEGVKPSPYKSTGELMYTQDIVLDN